MPEIARDQKLHHRHLRHLEERLVVRMGQANRQRHRHDEFALRPDLGEESREGDAIVGVGLLVTAETCTSRCPTNAEHALYSLQNMRYICCKTCGELPANLR